MYRLIACLALVLFACAFFVPVTTQCSDCTSVSTSEVVGNCVIKHWSVCCEGPGPGEVSCFAYDETVYCSSDPIPDAPPRVPNN